MADGCIRCRCQMHHNNCKSRCKMQHAVKQQRQRALPVTTLRPPAVVARAAAGSTAEVAAGGGGWAQARGACGRRWQPAGRGPCCCRQRRCCCRLGRHRRPCRRGSDARPSRRGSHRLSCRRGSDARPCRRGSHRRPSRRGSGLGNALWLRQHWVLLLVLLQCWLLRRLLLLLLLRRARFASTRLLQALADAGQITAAAAQQVACIWLGRRHGRGVYRAAWRASSSIVHLEQEGQLLDFVALLNRGTSGGGRKEKGWGG